MFSKHSTNGYTEIIKGIRIKTLCYGQSTLMAEFLLEKGALLPEHAHPNEQTGYLVSGRIRLFINGNSRDLVPGDSWNISGNMGHRAEILEDSVAIEVFSPVREDYLKYMISFKIARHVSHTKTDYNYFTDHCSPNTARCQTKKE